MALIQVNYLSECLMRPYRSSVILPVDKLTFPGNAEEGGGSLIRTLYPSARDFRKLYGLGVRHEDTEMGRGERPRRSDAVGRQYVLCEPGGEP